MSALGGISEVIADWREVVRELPDNPLKLHLGTARRRALSRVPLIRRLLLPLMILAGYTLLFLGISMVVLSYGATTRDYVSGAVYYLLGLVSLYWLLLLCQGVYDLCLDCLSLLSRRGNRGTQLCLDESLAGAPLSSREILAGALSVIAMPLLRRVLAGGLVFALFVMVSSIDVLDMGGGSIWNALALLPFGVAAYCLSAVMGLFAFGLAMIGFGLDQRSSMLTSSAAAIHSGAQFIYPLIAIAPLLEGMNLHSFDTESYVWEISLQLCGLLIMAALYLLFCWMVFSQSSASRMLRSFWLLAVPFFLPLSAALVALFGMFNWGFSSFASLFSGHVVWAFGALSLANPLASMGQFSFGSSIIGWEGRPLIFALELARLGLFFIMQFGALLLSARFAEHAVLRWRQAAE